MTDQAAHDLQIRMRAFEWLERQVDLHGEALPWTLLRHGFEFEGQRVPLMTQRGIFKPRVLPEIPLSITTSPSNPYGDAFGPDGYLRYRYQGENPGHPDNVGLRKAKARTTPLIYLHGLVKGKYMATWPAARVDAVAGPLRTSCAR